MQFKELEQYTPSDKEVYMNRRQLQYFRERLLMELEDLNAVIAQYRTRVQSLHPERSDFVDLSFAETKMTMQLNKLNHYHKKRKQVMLALERIDKGAFGYCFLTGNEIGIKRLKVLPWATMAVETQQMLETSPQQTPCSDYTVTFSSGYNDFPRTDETHIENLDYKKNKTILYGDGETTFG